LFLAAVSAAGRAQGALVVVDACQTLGQLPIDLAGTAVDGLIFTGRKYLRAPRGTGGFVIRRPLLQTKNRRDLSKSRRREGGEKFVNLRSITHWRKPFQ